MKTTPICYYTDDPQENETRCARCGRYIQYSHIVIDDEGNKVGMGLCCVRALRRTGEITGRLPRNGRYDWKMADVRQAAYWAWYGESIAHAN